MGEAGDARLNTWSSGPSRSKGSQMSWGRCRNRGLLRSSRRFVSEPVTRLSTDTTEAAPSWRRRSQR
jgi:hypothetical protein